MIEVGTEELNGNIFRDTDLKVSILNAPYGPYLKKGDYYPFKISNFIKDDLNVKKQRTEKQNKELTNEERLKVERERSKRLSSYGHEMMEEIRAIERMR
jgi:hypothetical protein